VEPSEAAKLARERLQDEIERVRIGVEEMLAEQEGRRVHGHGVNAEELRRELDELRIETRSYVKRRVRKSEKRIRRSVRDLEARSDRLEQRIDQVEADREAAEWRVHSNTEAMLDGLLEDVRAIADRLAGQPPASNR
jgi:chromosome segregation ATPase